MSSSPPSYVDVRDSDLRERWQLRSVCALVAGVCSALVYEYASGYACGTSVRDDVEAYALGSLLCFVAVLLVSTVRWTGERFRSDASVPLTGRALTSLAFFDARSFAWAMEAVHIASNGLLIAALASAYEMRLVCGTYQEGILSHAIVYLYGVHVFVSCVSHVRGRSGSIYAGGYAARLPTLYYATAFLLATSSVVLAAVGDESTGDADPMTDNTTYAATVSLSFGAFLVFVAQLQDLYHQNEIHRTR